VWAGNRFVLWGTGVAYESTDGELWTATPTVPANLTLGPVAYNPETGTFVGVRGGWQVWYDEQRFYRSGDGVRWDTLTSADAPGGHPLRFIAFGRGQPSAACAP
jgi:hypothetical protein